MRRAGPPQPHADEARAIGNAVQKNEADAYAGAGHAGHCRMHGAAGGAPKGAALAVCQARRKSGNGDRSREVLRPAATLPVVARAGNVRPPTGRKSAHPAGPGTSPKPFRHFRELNLAVL